MRTKIFFTYLLFGGVVLVRGQDANPLSADAKGAWTIISSNVVKAAEKMPEEKYSFRPTDSVRSFGQLVGHVADANFLFCSFVSQEKKQPPGAEKSLHSKAELVASLKDSVSYCNTAYEKMTDAHATDQLKVFGKMRAALSVLYINVAHENEHYGNIVTYLRLNGIVPPSSETRASAAAPKLYFDRAHGEAPIPATMASIASRLNMQIASFEEPISETALRGSNLLYLRAPSKTFAETEKSAIVTYVKGGGALLLVLDEEHRQMLSKTGVNDLISPFGMRLTPDTPYVPNPGAIALAGEINRANREIPYDGGRAVEGGTPFAFQLDKDGRPGPPSAAWQKVDGGGRLVVMGEGMASLFLGSPNGQRLTPVPNGGDMNLYWGKDSEIFMEEVISWLTAGRKS